MPVKNKIILPIFFLTVLGLLVQSCEKSEKTLALKKEAHIVLIGNNLASRMLHFDHFETEMQLRYPDSLLRFRNMGDGGNTPGFRPHSSRNSPWAFPGAEKFQTELAQNSGSEGHFETEDEWLARLKADIIIAFFGYNESFQGEAGLENYKAELRAFIAHTKNQKYNGKNAPQLALVSPIAFEDLSAQRDLPNGEKENENLARYTEAMKEVAATDSIFFVDAFNASKTWYAEESENVTADGFQLNDLGYQKLGKLLADTLFGTVKSKAEENRKLVYNAILERNWFWHNDFKIPNGVHAYGRRFDPFGPDNYPAEIEKIREMTAIRDKAIWAATKGQKVNLAAEDAKTKTLPPVATNYRSNDKEAGPKYLYGEDALHTIKVAEGYKIELFASEAEFPDLANPTQISFDNKGRLWVGVMPSYPHYRPGDSKPNDKLLILEDTNGDGKADTQTIFADGLHLTIGFEFAPEGVYVSQGTNLVLITDTDGDDKADTKEIILSGFDDHDTHHAISAFTTDPSGALFMAEGVFLHTNVETAYGPVRATNGGFYRYSPQRHHLERTAQLSIPNPWGIAFDDWGQQFFAHTSGPDMTWMMPGTLKPRYGVASPLPKNLIEEKHRVRPTSGLEFISSRHFPDDVQGDIIINNTIGFLGTKQHTLKDDPNSAGYLSTHRMDLITSSDPNFRPVDMEFAPDGSLYVIDWHNILIGHMQHNARDPLRDHVHGRIYRITYPSRPLVTPAKVAGATIEALLENLKLPEYRTKYRTKRELRARDTPEVLSKLAVWVQNLDTNDSNYEHHLLEALWVSWGLNQIDTDLLKHLLNAKDFRARAAAVRVLRYAGHQIPDQADLLLVAAQDENPRVRLEALVAASWLEKDKGIPIVIAAGTMPLDDWMQLPYEAALAHLNGHKLGEVPTGLIEDTELKDEELSLYLKGEEIYKREGFCMTCHQPDGKGLSASQFPPLAGSKWVTGSQERLIRLTLHGMIGPIEVNGKSYPGQVPMTPFGGMLNDEEMAAVLTYVRNTFGNNASSISAEKVKAEREKTKNKKGFYTSEELLKDFPME
ncbi:PVC-type heme-binding CxxCH protein [Arenibacter sp. GZD96]|uniref:PVC-type heme-binding CxxCH protein n=1 Tax=Aurantibrevibacter litoralis TaxID=3106030 RepID=UPI002AFDE596|nr:PVC-type heme-binding CxxCH protein [Arenibacter sp. GZD-96]MEA1784644.1 PVC-type heme-binding CxxCH protein [Arenibacter sp. GZD-96]